MLCVHTFYKLICKKCAPMMKRSIRFDMDCFYCRQDQCLTHTDAYYCSEYCWDRCGPDAYFGIQAQPKNKTENL